MNSVALALQEKIKNREAVIGVIGLGYVGLPLTLAFAEKGFDVLGFDVDPAKPEFIAAGQCYIKHLDGGRLREAVSSGRLRATTDFDRLSETDAVLICVPTPLTPQREPDMRFVEASAGKVGATLRSGQLVVLESTTYPGTTDDLVRRILENPPGGDGETCPSRLVCGEDYFLAFSPEREDPGNPQYGTTNTPKVVGGVDEVSGDLADDLYSAVIESTVRVSSARTAEASKLTENIFRAVNIALVNELKVVYDRMGVDVWEVLDAAATKPFGFMRFNPGPGWGGHCIPLDPFYLAWKAREHGVVPKVATLIVEHRMLDRVVVSSFSPEALQLMKTTDPAVITATLFNKELHTDRDPLEIIMEVGSRGFNISGKRLTVEMVERCHKHGIPVAVYTVNEPSEMRRLMELGVDAVFTDHPDQMLEVVEEGDATRAAGSGS